MSVAISLDQSLDDNMLHSEVDEQTPERKESKSQVITNQSQQISRGLASMPATAGMNHSTHNSMFRNNRPEDNEIKESLEESIDDYGEVSSVNAINSGTNAGASAGFKQGTTSGGAAIEGAFNYKASPGNYKMANEADLRRDRHGHDDVEVLQQDFAAGGTNQNRLGGSRKSAGKLFDNPKKRLNSANRVAGGAGQDYEKTNLNSGSSKKSKQQAANTHGAGVSLKIIGFEEKKKSIAKTTKQKVNVKDFQDDFQKRLSTIQNSRQKM